MGEFDDLMDRIAAELDEIKKRLRPRREELQHTFEKRSAPIQPSTRRPEGEPQKNLHDSAPGRR